MSVTSSRIPSLDGWRAVSILLVLSGHMQGVQNFPHLPLLAAMGDLAAFGVNVFFIISGFLITSLLINERERTGGISLKEFYRRRVIRILPASYAFIVLIAVAAQLGWLQVSGKDLAVAFGYVTNYDLDRSWNIGHLWSLSIEEQFYLLWPVLFIVLSQRRALMVAVLAFAAAPMVRAGMHLVLDGPARDLEIFPAMVDGISIGCVMALVRPWLLERTGYLRLTASPWLWLLLPVILLANRERAYGVVDLFIWPWMLIATTVLVEASTRQTTTWIGRTLNWRPVVFLGVLSYSLYLWQQPFLNRHAAAFATSFPVNLGFALGMALMSYYLIERPFLRWRHRPARVVAATPPVNMDTPQGLGP